MSIDKISASSTTYLERKHIVPMFEEAFHQVLLSMPNDPLIFLESAFKMQTPIRIVVIGPPYNNQSTLCALIAEKYNLLHIKHWELTNNVTSSQNANFIREKEEQNESNVAVNNKILSDEEVSRLIVEAAKRGEREHNGWIFDNYPQSSAQAIYLQKQAICPQKVFVINTSDEVYIQRCNDINTLQNTDVNTRNVTLSETRRNAQIELQRQLSTFHARKNELMDCYKPFLVPIDDTYINTINECNLTENATTRDKEICSKLSCHICDHIDAMQKNQ